MDIVLSRPTYAEISIPNFLHNIRVAKRLSGSDIIAIVKADAYGHGALPLALAGFEKEGVRNFAVATMGEAIELSKVINPNLANILVLGYISDAFLGEAIVSNMVLPVFDDYSLKAVSEAGKKVDKIARVALEIDTGMKRLGFNASTTLIKDLKSKHSNINVVHVLSHLATYDNDFTQEQTELFDKFLENNKGEKFTTSFLNSSGLVLFENRWNLTRPGIMLYGYDSASFIKDLKPVMRVFSSVTHIKQIKRGESVGYGRTFVADKDMIIGVVPIGYADGYPRLLSNNAFMIVGGKRCKVLGTICMDMTMIDITEIYDNKVRDKVVEILSENITADDLAKWSNSISYEILTGISSRVTKIYKN